MLTPFLDFLDETGAPVERALEATSLPAHIFRDRDYSLPTRALHGFVALAGRPQGVDNIGLRVSLDLGMGPPADAAIDGVRTLAYGPPQRAGGRSRLDRLADSRTENGGTR